MGSFSRSGSGSVSDGSRFYSSNGYSKVPVLVQWMATLKCNLSCQHCLSVSLDNGFTDMPLSSVEKLIDEVSEMGVEEFLVTGGEPLARNDLPEIIDYLGFRGQNWSLNTAVMPSEYQMKALRENSPGFVAVSLDGPREVHDSFRGRKGAWKEAIEAIRFFKSLPGVRVCAGTTVTNINYRYLDETFHLVTASGADQWGIHLLVPEGRASHRTDLFLSKRQLRQLVKFVARKRGYFNVEMADEIGYLGSMEPLVRDFPLACGAGRSQCVILPDGEVVRVQHWTDRSVRGISIADLSGRYGQMVSVNSVISSLMENAESVSTIRPADQDAGCRGKMEQNASGKSGTFRIR